MRFILTFCLLVLIGTPAFAQDTGSSERLALAEKVNAANPVTRQLEASVLRIATEWGLAEKEKFRREMMATIDLPAMEKASAQAMADTFTKEELQVMLEYYNRPEASKIMEKMPIYQGLMQPGISREIDKALMKLRTGYEAQQKTAPVTSPVTTPATTPVATPATP